MSRSANPSDARAAGGYRRPPHARRFGAAGATLLLVMGIGSALLSRPAPAPHGRDDAKLSVFDVPMPKAVRAPVPRRTQPRQAAAPSRPVELPMPTVGPADSGASRSAASLPANTKPSDPVAAPPPVSLAPLQPPARAAASDARSEYAARLWRHIAGVRPRGIRLAGTTLLAFAVDADGTIGQLRIVRGSGNAMLDQLALRSVRRASPAPAPPASLGDTPAFAVPFSFD